MTIGAAEVAQVSSDCLSQFDFATAGSITQQVRSFFCQTLLAQTSQNRNWKFTPGRHPRDKCNARRPANADIELSAAAKICHSSHSSSDTRGVLGAHGR